MESVRECLHIDAERFTLAPALSLKGEGEDAKAA